MSIRNFMNVFTRRQLRRIEELERQLHDLEEARNDLRDVMQAEKEGAANERRALVEKGKDELADVRRQIKQLEDRIAREDQELAHLIKMKESKLQMDYDRKVIELERKAAAEIERVKNEYRDKLETQLNAQLAGLDARYAELLARLPNIEVALKGRVGG